MKTYLSLGAGVDTTAILLIPEIMKEVDFILFADTGAEHPETYEYIRGWIKPFLEQLHIPLYVVEGSETINKKPVTDMEQAYKEWKMIPVRFMRHCTDKWKIRPMKKFLSGKYPGEELRAIVGFAYDEMHRRNDKKWEGYTVWYPLIDMHLTRKDCQVIIARAGWPMPPKSGCFFCPFSRLEEWKDLRYMHPELWERAKALEKNGSLYPKLTLSNFRQKGEAMTLEQVDEKLGSKTLMDFDNVLEDDECGGVCRI